MDYPITNSTIKLLKFILHHQNCTLADIQKAFENDVDEMELINLGLTEYLVCTHANGHLTQFKDGNFAMKPESKFWASPKAVKLLEDRRREWLQWVVPNVLSTIALILSLITLWLSLLPQVTEVRILP